MYVCAHDVDYPSYTHLFVQPGHTSSSLPHLLKLIL